MENVEDIDGEPIDPRCAADDDVESELPFDEVPCDIAEVCLADGGNGGGRPALEPCNECNGDC